MGALQVTRRAAPVRKHFYLQLETAGRGFPRAARLTGLGDDDVPLRVFAARRVEQCQLHGPPVHLPPLKGAKRRGERCSARPRSVPTGRAATSAWCIRRGLGEGGSAGQFNYLHDATRHDTHLGRHEARNLRRDASIPCCRVPDTEKRNKEAVPG